MVNSKLYFGVNLVKVTRPCQYLKKIMCFTNVDGEWLIGQAGKNESIRICVSDALR